MTFLRFLARSFARPARWGCARTAVRRHPARPSLTPLEDRFAPAILTVNSLADGPVSASSSALTLREAVALVDTGGTATDSSGKSLAAATASQINTTNPFGVNDVIQFAPTLFGSAPQQIVLTDGSLQLDRNVTISDPAASQLAVSGNKQSTVFEVASGATVSISGLTIEAGAASGNSGGGGIANDGTLTLSNTIVFGNTAGQGNGGGIANSGTLTLLSSTVSDNAALNDGGIDSTGTLTLLSSTVSGNTAVQGNGGLANYGGVLKLVDSTVSGNTALGGGGLGNYDGGTATLLNSIVSDNSASSEAGGIANSATLMLVGSTVSGNAAVNDGGIDSTGTLTLLSSTVSGNTAVVGNGGLANYGGAMTLVNSTVSGNTAFGAGGLGNYDGGTVTLLNSIVSDNSASGEAGGIAITGSLILVGSTVSGNAAFNDAGIANNGTLTLNESTVSGNTAVVGNGGIVNYGGVMTLINSTVSGNSVGASANTPAPTPTDSAASSNQAPNSTGIVNNAELALAESFSSDSGHNEVRSGTADAPQTTGSIAPANPADGSANTGALPVKDVAASGGSAGTDNGSAEGDLTPSKNDLPSHPADDRAVPSDSIQTTADRIVNTVAQSSEGVVGASEGKSSGQSQETLSLWSQGAPASEWTTAAVFAKANAENDRAEWGVRLDREGFLDQQPGFEGEWTPGYLTGLLVPWFSSCVSLREEPSPLAQEILERNEERG